MGDMFYLARYRAAERVHGAFVADDEGVTRLVDLPQKIGPPDYIEGILPRPRTIVDQAATRRRRDTDDGESDALYDQAVEIVTEPARLDLAGAAPSAHRLQPRRA